MMDNRVNYGEVQRDTARYGELMCWCGDVVMFWLKRFTQRAQGRRRGRKENTP